MKEGNALQIGKDVYDILESAKEVDRFDTEKNVLIGEHEAIRLHKRGSKSLHPTHLLKIYSDNKNEAVLFEIIQEKHSENIKNPRQRGVVFSYINERRILIKEIKIIHK